MKALIIALSAVLLVGCQTAPKDPRVVAFEAGKKTVELDKRYLMECSDLELLKDGTDKAALEAIEAWTAQYKACRTWKRELNKIVRDAFNIGN